MKQLKLIVINFMVLALLATITVTIADPKPGPYKPKKGHWTNNCDCKWPGKACNRKGAACPIGGGNGGEHELRFGMPGCDGCHTQEEMEAAGF